MKQTKLSKASWLTIILFGLIGQIAWSIENMQFNLFLFDYIGGTTSDIASMVAWSAIVSTFATLVMGIVTDRIGKRKIFLCGGYVLWGIATICFAFISRENTAKLFPSLNVAEVLARTAFFVILMDCIMSFFGSLANDASFNAWVTETTDETNRTIVEGVLNVFPLFAMLVVAGASGIIVSMIGWPLFFVLMGVIVLICGLLGFFFVPESKPQQSEDMGIIKSIMYGFQPKVMKENKMFYIALGAMCIFNIAVQVFMPYLLIYLEKTLQFDTITYSIVMAVVIILASIMSVLFGRITDSFGKRRMCHLAITLFVVGLILASMMKTPILFIIAGTIMMSGYVAISVVFMATVRDYTPLKHVGMFQGIRLFAYVLIPMIVGPWIGNFLIQQFSQGTYVNSYGEVVLLPVPMLFVIAAIISLLLLLPANRLFHKQEG